MAEISNATETKRKGFSRSTKNRRSTRVDLTPMVDLGFLLITFFVFTTSIGEAKALEITESHDGDSQPVKASAAMTIILGTDHSIYYYDGLLNAGGPSGNIKKTDFKKIRSLIEHKKRTTDPDYLMYIIKAHDASRFGDNINLLDEKAICNIKPGHYAEVELTDQERDLIK